MGKQFSPLGYSPFFCKTTICPNQGLGSFTESAIPHKITKKSGSRVQCQCWDLFNNNKIKIYNIKSLVDTKKERINL